MMVLSQVRYGNRSKDSLRLSQCGSVLQHLQPCCPLGLWGAWRTSYTACTIFKYNFNRSVPFPPCTPWSCGHNLHCRDLSADVLKSWSVSSLLWHSVCTEGHSPAQGRLHLECCAKGSGQSWDPVCSHLSSASPHVQTQTIQNQQTQYGALTFAFSISNQFLCQEKPFHLKCYLDKSLLTFHQISVFILLSQRKLPWFLCTKMCSLHP